MSIRVQYMVKCAGGGWLVPGRPLACLGVAHKFPSAIEAFLAGQRARWTHDVVTFEHRCPAHQTGDGHVHSFRKPKASWPEGPDGETGTIRACVCGETRTESEG
jgi:hypothetical protein